MSNCKVLWTQFDKIHESWLQNRNRNVPLLDNSHFLLFLMNFLYLSALWLKERSHRQYRSLVEAYNPLGYIFTVFTVTDGSACLTMSCSENFSTFTNWKVPASARATIHDHQILTSKSHQSHEFFLSPEIKWIDATSINKPVLVSLAKRWCGWPMGGHRRWKQWLHCAQTPGLPYRLAEFHAYKQHSEA